MHASSVHIVFCPLLQIFAQSFLLYNPILSGAWWGSSTCMIHIIQIKPYENMFIVLYLAMHLRYQVTSQRSVIDEVFPVDILRGVQFPNISHNVFLFL